MLNLPQPGDLTQMTNRRSEHRSRDQERQHEQQPHGYLEPVNPPPQRIAVGPDPAGESPDQPNLRRGSEAPVPRPSHSDSIPARGQFSRVGLTIFTNHACLPCGQARLCALLTLQRALAQAAGAAERRTTTAPAAREDNHDVTERVTERVTEGTTTWRAK